MSSSATARMVLGAMWFVATMVLTSAQLRVVPAAPPRFWRYVLAWFGSTLILGALLWTMDNTLGAADWGRRLMNASVAGVLAAAGLVAGSLLTRRLQWQRLNGLSRFLTLAVLHAVIVFAIGYPLI
jgi:hypothetical protein